MCLGQSSYQGLTPGTSTRAEVEKSLGQPARTEGRVSAYPAPAGSEIASIVVQYRTGSDIAERIEVYFPDPADRSGVLRALKIPDKPEATKTVNGKLVEYFGFPALLALTHTGAAQVDGISSISYYNRDFYDRMLGKPAATSAAGDSSPTNPARADQLAASAAKPSAGNSSPAGPSGNSAQAKPSNDVAPDPNSAPSSETASSASSSSSGSSPSAYTGPSSGTITWSGETNADQVITIEGNHTASGSVQGGLPGVPVQLDLDTREYAVVEAPAPSNGWKRLSIRSKHKRQAVISIHWAVLQ